MTKRTKAIICLFLDIGGVLPADEWRKYPRARRVNEESTRAALEAHGLKDPA